MAPLDSPLACTRMSHLLESSDDEKMDFPQDLAVKMKWSTSTDVVDIESKHRAITPRRRGSHCPPRSPHRSKLMSPLRSPLSCSQVVMSDEDDENIQPPSALDLSWSKGRKKYDGRNNNRYNKKQGNNRPPKSPLFRRSPNNYNTYTMNQGNIRTPKSPLMSPLRSPFGRSKVFPFDDDGDNITQTSTEETSKMVWATGDSSVDRGPVGNVKQAKKKKESGFTPLSPLASVRSHLGLNQANMYADISGATDDDVKGDEGAHKFKAKHAKKKKSIFDQFNPNSGSHQTSANKTFFAKGDSRRKKNSDKKDSNLAQRVFSPRGDKKKKETLKQLSPKMSMQNSLSSMRSFISSNVPTKPTYHAEKSSKDKSLISHIDDENEDLFVLPISKGKEATQLSSIKAKVGTKVASGRRTRFGLSKFRRAKEDEKSDDYLGVDEESTIDFYEEENQCDVPVVVEDPKRLEIIVREGANACPALFGKEKGNNNIENLDLLNPLNFSDSKEGDEWTDFENKTENEWQPIIDREKYTSDDGQVPGPLDGRHFC